MAACSTRPSYRPKTVDSSALSIYTETVIFAWDDWNREHIARHGVTPEEAEEIVEHAIAPFPRDEGEGKYIVWGRTEVGRYLQVVFAYRPHDEVDHESLSFEELMDLSSGAAIPVVYVVHAMPLTPTMLRRFRRQRR
jgi:uncharacterized DUF497 family protein